MKQYKVEELAKLSGVSVRTLHYYDQIGLLKPAFRTEKNYRIYSENELYRLQQILIQKQLGLTLSEISDTIDNENIDRIQLLEAQKEKILAEQKRMSKIIKTIDKTILKLKSKIIMKDEELYDGFSKEEALALQKEAKDKFGKKNVGTSENYLKKLSKSELKKLKDEQQEILKQLSALLNEEVNSDLVQNQIAKHYLNTRQFWGTHGSPTTQKKQYKGLGQLYLSDLRYTEEISLKHPNFPIFLSNAIEVYADANL